MKGYVVVLLTGDSDCEKYQGNPCVMSVLGPYTRDEADKVLLSQPEWSKPHVLTMHREGVPE